MAFHLAPPISCQLGIDGLSSTGSVKDCTIMTQVTVEQVWRLPLGKASTILE